MARCTAPSAPRFEHHDGSVLGIGAAAPRLSWTIDDAEPGFAQTAYEVEVTRAETTRVFTVEASDQVLVPWPAEPLVSREEAAVRVRVRDAVDWSPWSATSTVEAGLLSPEDWAASFISPRTLAGLETAAPVVRGRFDLPAAAVGRLRLTAHGVYEARLNGQRVGDEVLAPGWTSYSHRLRYQTHDVTDLLREGSNELEVVLGNGWFRGRLGFLGGRGLYGDRLALLAQLEVTDAHGELHVVGTDDSWTAAESGVLADDLYDGQRTDLRRPMWGSESAADVVDVVPVDLGVLVAPDGPPVRVTQVVPAVQVLRSPSGATILDFGQVLVGWVRLRVRGLAAGAEVLVRHAEVLEDGELGVRPLRTARATDTYLVAGGGEEILEPGLTFHGFRYAEVSGAGEVRGEDAEAVVIGSDLQRTGWFSCSDPMLARFHDNVVWGLRGNTVDVPTDCPQRDERLGWTGDIQVFSPTAAFLFNVGGFLTSWLADLSADQLPDGSVPYVIPDVLHDPAPTAAAWGDAAAVVPWVLHERTGDTGILARQLPSMRAWVDRLDALAGESHLWAGGFQFGDWLDPSAPPDDPFAAKTAPDVVATAHLIRSADLVAQVASILGQDAVAGHYRVVAAAARSAFGREYVTPGGRLLSDAPTAYAMALQWDLLPTSEQRVGAQRRLADLVRASGFHINTGFVGTPLVTDALVGGGDVDVAYRLLLQTSCPSWLYPVTMGATTVWERWDSLLPDGSINPGEMTSFNHYALGAVADWLHRVVAGLAPAEPGYRRLLVEPRPCAALTSARARHLTPYGEAAVSWERDGGVFTVDVLVPVGARATVRLPGQEEQTVGHGAYRWEVPDPCRVGGHRIPRTVRDVFDDPAIWTEVVNASAAAGVATDETAVAKRLTPFLDDPAGEVVERLFAHGPRDGYDTLTKQLQPLLAP